MGVYTQTLVNLKLRGRIASTVLILVLLLVFNEETNSQAINTCGRPGLTGLEVLTAAGVDAGHIAHNGIWQNIPAGITINSNGTNNDQSDDIITWTGGIGSSYVLEWNHHVIYTVTINVTGSCVAVCEDGVLQLGNTFDNLSPVPVNGHRDKGYWSCSSPDITFNNPNLPDAIASGFQLGSLYTITWNHQGGASYSLTVNTYAVAQQSDWVLINENGMPEAAWRQAGDVVAAETADVVLCSATDYSFRLPWDGDFSFEAFDFWVTHDDDGTSFIWEDNVPNDGILRGSERVSISSGNGSDEYRNLDKIWAIVNDDDGCQVKTNEIRISNISTINVRVQGGASACQANVAALGLNLEVLPFDPSYTYRWYRNGTLVATDIAIYPITQIGDYYVEVDGCSSPPPYQSNTVTVTENLLPEVTISGNDICAIPLGSTSTITSAETSANGIGSFSYVWQWNNVDQPALGTGPNTSVNSVGLYSLKLVSDADDQCYNVSNILPIDVVTPPLQQNVTGINICKAATSATTTIIGLDNSEAGVQYILQYDNGITVTDVQVENRVTNGAFDFASPVAAFGTYTVVARAGTCADVNMIGAVEVTQNVTVQNMTRLTGNNCSNQSHVFGVDATDDASVVYSLYHGAAIVESKPGLVTGGAISFNGVTAPGTYTVRAVRGICNTAMTGFFVIQQAPNVAGISIVGTDGCSHELKNIGITPSEAGVTYELLLANNSMIPVVDNIGDGGAIDLVTNTTLLAGSYTVRAESLNGCRDLISGSIIISDEPNDIPFSVAGTVCGTGNVIINPGEAGVTYHLYEGVGAASTPIGLSFTGNGIDPIIFNALTTGYYTVMAEKGSCSKLLSSFLEVEAPPLDQNVTVLNDNYCANEAGVTIQVDATQINLDYELFNVGTGLVNQTITSPGGVISFTNVTAGTYDVRVRNISCTRILEPNVLITEHPVSVVNANFPSDFCSDAGPQIIMGTPTVVAGSSTGVYSVIGGAGYDPTAIIDPNTGSVTFNPANCAFETLFTISYIYTDGNGCVVEDIATTTVHDLTNGAVSITGNIPAELCQDDNTDYTLQGLLNLVQVAGTFSSTSAGLKNIDAVNGTAEFNSQDAGNGTHIINFNYIDPVTNCTGSATLTVEVGTPVTIIGLADEYCSNDNTDYPLIGHVAGALPVPVTDITTFEIIDPDNITIASGIPNNTQNFNPLQVVSSNGGKTGVYQVVYKYQNGACTNKIIQDITLKKAPDATFVFPNNVSGIEQDNFCSAYGLVTLTSNDPDIASYNSQYSLNGALIGNSFNTITGAVNMFPTANSIFHRVENKGCVSTATRTFYVNEPNGSLLGLCSEYFENDAPFIISASELDRNLIEAKFEMFSSNGSSVAWLTDNNDNTATITPTGHPGTNYRVVMTLTGKSDGCKQIVEQEFNIYSTLNFTGVTDSEKICQASGIINLQANSIPAGGTGVFNPIAGLTNTSNGQATFDPSLTVPGVYNIKYDFTGADGCFHTISKTVEIVSAPTDLYTVVGGGAFCNLAPAATKGVTVGLSGSTTGVVYELLLNGIRFSPAVTFTGNGSAFNFQNAGTDILFQLAGRYSVEATQNTCNATMNGTVDVVTYEPVLQLDNKTDVTCNGLTNGTVTLLGTGGSGNYEYSIDAGVSWQASPVFAGLDDGTYDFSIRDISLTTDKCSERLNILTVIITEPSLITITDELGLKVDVGCCVTACEGSATISISGGTPDFTAYPLVGYGIIWSTGGTALTETEMPVGNHSVTVTDGNGCSQNIAVDITANPSVTLTEDPNPALHVDNVCHLGTTGSFVVTANGGSGSYEFSLTDPATTTEVWLPGNIAANQYLTNGLAAGSYNVWVRDADPLYNMCIAQVTVPVEITEPAAITIIEEDQTPITCNGAIDATFTVRALGGLSGIYSFSLTDPALGATWVAANNGVDGYTASGVGAGIHSIWVRDAINTTCTYSKVDVNILSISALNYILDEHTNVSCHSGNDGRLEVTGQGGSGTYVYQWEYPLGTIISTDKFIENRNAGDYHLTIQDANDPTNVCTPITQTFTISEPTALKLSLVDNKISDCTAYNTGELEINVSGGTTDFMMYPGLGYDITWSNGEVNKEKIENLSPADYTVEVTDANGCTVNNVTTPYTVGVLNDITLESSNLIHNKCFGEANGGIIVKVDGGSTLYQFRLQGDKIVDWSDPVPMNSDEFTWSNLGAGNYEVLVRDAAYNACEYSLGNFTITEATEILISYDPTIDVKHVTCHSGNDGSLTVTSTGGSGLYNYSSDNGTTWFTGQPAIYTFSNLSKGTYFIKVRDNFTCESTNILTVDISEVAPLSFALNPAVSHVSCESGNDGEIIVTGQGGSGNYDYSIDGGTSWQTTGTFSNLVAGIYQLSIRDRANATCEQINLISITVTQPNDFVTSEDITKHTDVNCFGDATGSFTVHTTGGEGTFEYRLFDGSVYSTWQASPIFSNLVAQTYQVSVRDMGTIAPAYCEKTNVLSITINEPADQAIIDNVNITDVTCYNLNTGSIDVTVSGGTAPYNYQWTRISDNALIVPTIPGNPVDLLADSYKLTITDGNGCSVTQSYVVNQPTAITVTHTATHITVVGNNDGTITVNQPTGGVAPYTISWSDGAAFDGLWYRDNLAAATYTYTILDANNCSVNKDVTVIGSVALDFFMVTAPLNCFGSQNGIIDVTITGGTGPFDIEWNGTLYDATTVTGNATGISANYSISALYAGTYTVKLTDANGELSKIKTVSQPNELTITPAVIEDITCNGSGDGRIEVNVNSLTDPSAYTMNWSGPGGYAVSGTVATVSNQTNLNIPGDYYVTVNYNGTCSITEVYTISEPVPVSVITDAGNTSDISCAGGADGQIGVIASGGVGFGYKWYKWNPALAGVDKYELIAGETNPVIKGRDAGWYKVITQLFSTGCTVEHEVILSDPAPLTLSLTPTDITTCYGDDSGVMALTIGGGVAPYIYNYGAGDIILPATQTFKEIDKLEANNYTIVITDNNGCTLTGVETITEPDALQVNVIDFSISCEIPAGGPDGFLELNIGGGNLVGGVQNYLITLKPTTGLLITRTVNNSTGAAVTELFNNLAPDHYELNVYDQNSTSVDKCVYTDTFDLELIAINGNALNASCQGVNDGQIQNITISGASINYTYNWSSPDGGIGFDNATFDQAGLSQGTYRLEINDVTRACIVSKDFVVDTDREIILDAAVTDVSCFGTATGAIDVKPNRPGYDYTWTGPGITAANEKSEDLSSIVAGRYQLVVADRSCGYIVEYEVVETSKIDYTLSYELTSCIPYQRTIVISALSGGAGNPATDYTYTVSGPGTVVQNIADKKKFLITQGGEYTVEVFDKNLCSVTKTITVPSELVANEIVTDVACNGGNTGSIILNLNGGSGVFNYVWTKAGDSTFNETTPTISNLTAGEYTVIVTDVIESDHLGNCTRSWTFEVKETQAIAISINKGDITCNGDNDGFINLDINGGVAPYNYYWSPVSGGIVQGNQNQNSLYAGNYSITVIDANNCSTTETIVLAEDAPVTGVLNIIDTACDGTNGTIELVPAGGTGAYSYNWSTSDGSHAALDNTLTTQTGLTGGTYTVIISDNDVTKSACKTTLTATLTKAIEVENLVLTDIPCVGSNTGRIAFDVTGGDGNYTYTWTTLEGDPGRIQNGVRNQSGLSAGRYQVEIRDGRTALGTDCSIVETFEIKETNPIAVSASVTDVECFGANTGEIYVSISGGSNNFNFSWNNGVYTTQNLNGVPAGTYTLILTDNILGCTVSQSYIISDSGAALSIDLIAPSDIKCADEATGEIQLGVSGGTAPYTYLWTGTNNPNGDHPTGLTAGTYSVIVQDAKNCQVASGNIVLSQPTPIVIDPELVIAHASTPGGTEGAIEISVSGGSTNVSGDYTYEWFKNGVSIGNNNSLLSNIGTGTYDVLVTDDNNCSERIDGIFIEEPGLALGFNHTLYHVRPCNGSGNGIIDITSIYGGTKNIVTGSPTYRIQITQGALTLVDENALSWRYENVRPGTYLITITDGLGVIERESVTITEEPVLTILTSVISDATCYKGSDGIIEVIVNGGQPNANGDYLVEIVGDNGHYDSQTNAKANTAFNFTGLPRGLYTIRVTDHISEFTNTNHPAIGNCWKETTNSIAHPEAQVLLNVLPGDDEICAGEQATLTLSVSNWDVVADNVVVTLYDGDTYAEHTVNTSPFEIKVSPTVNRFYSVVKVAESGNTSCLKGFDITPAPIEVKVNKLPTATISSNISEVCLGNEVSLLVAFSEAGPWTFTWEDTNNRTSGTVTTSDNPYVLKDTPNADAQYVITSVSNGSCNNSGAGIVNVTVNANPTVALSGATAICYNAIAGATLHFNFTGQAPYTVVLEANSVEQTIVFNTNSEDWNVKPAETTNYVVKSVTDNNNCLVNVSGIEAIVTVNQLPEDISVIKVDDTQYVDGVCQGATGIAYSITPVNYATGGYTWTAPANSTIVSGNGTSNVILEFDTSFSGGYLQVKAVNACGDSRVTELWIPAKPLPGLIGAISGPVELCQGETGFSYSVVPVANATAYRWDLPAGFTIVGDNSSAAVIVDLDPLLVAVSTTIKVTPVNACGDGLNTSELNVEVFPLPVAYAGVTGNVCGSTGVYTMQADNPALLNPDFTGKWTVISGAATIANNTQYNTTVTNLSRGDVVFRWTVTNTAGATHQCDVYSDVTIRNNALSILASADNSTVCNSSAELTGTAIPADGTGVPFVNTTGLWKVVEPIGSGAAISQSGNNITSVSSLENGRNVFSWTITQNGCESTAQVEVINNEPSDAVITNGALVEVCDNQVSLTAVNPIVGNGTWSLVRGSGVIISPTNLTTVITGLSKGENEFRYAVENNGCTKSATVIVKNNLLDIHAGFDQTVCSDTYVLDATPADPANGITGQWSTPESVFFVNGQSATTEVQGLNQGDNVLTWTLTQKGCSSTASVTITNHLPSQAIVGANKNICAYETTLKANVPDVAGGEYGYWSVIKGAGKFDNFEQADTRVSALSNGENIFRWTISHEGCSSYADQIINNLHVNAYAGKDTAICGKTVTLTGNQPLPGDIGEWSLIPGVGGATYKPGDRNNPAILMGGLDYGENGFIWTIISEGCTSSDSIYVTNNNPYYEDNMGDKREITAGPPISLSSGSSASMQADAPVDGGTGVWSLISGGGNILNPTNAGTVIENLQRGESVFRWTVSKEGCTYWSDVTVTNGDIEEASAGRDQSVCVPEAALLANEPLKALGEWSVIDGAGTFVDKNKFNTIVTGLDAGENTFRWTLYNGATTDYDDVVITNNMVVEANAGTGGIVCNQDWYDVSGTIPATGRGVATWSVISGSGAFDNVNDPLTRINGLDQGDNILKYEIEFRGCISTNYVTIVNNTPTTPVAGDDITICTDSLQLTPNTPTFGTGEWVVTSGNADANALDINWAKKLAPGENILQWRITNNGCMLEDELIITNNQPTTAHAGLDKPVCDNFTKLSGNQPLSGMGVGHWELIAGSGTIANINDRESDVTGLGLGTNRFRWIIENNGCISSDEVNISYNLIEAFAGYQQVLCSDETVLEANIAYPGVGTWGVVAGGGTAVFDDLNNPNTRVSGLDPGTNTLTWTIDYGNCRSVSEVIIINDSPTAANAGDDQALCSVNTTTLNANTILAGRGTGTWTVRNGSGTFSDIAVNNPTLTDIAFGDNIFRWTVEHNGCTSVDDVVISYNRVEATVGSDQQICSDKTALEANSAVPGVGSWTVVGGTSQAIFDNQNDPNTSVSNLAKGVNVLRWSIDYRGCETNAEVNIINNSPSTAYAGNLQELCVDNTSLDATVPGPGTGTWEVLMGSALIADNTDAKTTVTGLSKGDNVFRWTVTNGICTSVDEVRVVNNEPSVPYAGKDEISCETFMALKAEEPSFGTGLWTIVSGGGNFDDPSSPNAVISNLNPGDNILKWTISKGHCELDHTITVTNNAAAVANAGPDIEDCKDWSELDANIPESGLGEGQWSLVSGKGEFDNLNNAKTTIRTLGFGENILMWTITNGSCFSSDQVIIFNKTPDQSAAGDDRITCEDYIVLNANNPVDGFGTWTVESGSGAFGNAHQYNTMVTGVGYGDNVYKWTIAYGDCVTEDVIVVTSNKAKPYAGEDDVSYETSYAMQAQNPGALSGTWTVVSGEGTFDDPHFFNTTVRDLAAGKNTFRWTINTAGCMAYDDVTIEYKEVPGAGFTVDKEAGCYPLEVKFTNYSVGGNTYSWDFGDGSTSNERNPVYTYETPGGYMAVLTVAGPDGNDAVFTQDIAVHDHPVANFDVGPEEVYLPEDEIKCYDMSDDAATWLWQFGDGQTSEEQNPSYTYSEEGQYSITLTVQNVFGCEDTFTIKEAVIAYMSGFVNFPTAFTPRPGGSGRSGTLGERNDAIFKPKTRDVEVFHMQIFNRWGQLIFETHDVNEGWDGNYKGKLAPQAVYVYKASGKFVNGREYNKAGSVLLVR